MYKPVLLFITLCALRKFCSSAPYYDDEKEYYWRRYTGVIPIDAVEGGKSNQDSTTYIGQVFYEGATISTEIRPNQSNVYFVWAGPRFVTENIKILCAKNPSKMVWIKANEKNYKYLWNKHVVMGGFHVLENRPYLIGRITHQGKSLTVGQVLTNDKEIRIYYIADGLEVSVANSDMELLSFNPDVSSDLAGNTTNACENHSVVQSKPLKPNSWSFDKLFNFNFN